MSAEKALALVVRGYDWSESSRITTLFTREFGKLRALAKGARRIRSSFDVAFDLLNVVQVVFLRSRSGGLDLLTEARLEERFPTLRSDLKKLYVGYYVAELLAEGTQDYDPHPRLFDEALATLRNLDKAMDSLAVATHFELAWLQELGYAPHLESCAVCGAASATEEGVALPMIAVSIAAGGILCEKCRPGFRDARPVSTDSLLMMRTLMTGPGIQTFPDNLRHQVRALLEQWVCRVLGKRPKMLAYINVSS